MENKKLKTEETRSWSDLPCDVVLSIMRRCLLAEQAITRAVCKNWNAAAASVSVTTKLPLLVLYDWEEKAGLSADCNYKFIERWHQQLYNYKNAGKRFKFLSKVAFFIIECGMKAEEWKDVQRSKIVASKKGWQLLQNMDRNRLFLCNPMAKHGIMRLPRLDVKIWPSRVALSGAPTSPDCVVFVAGNLRNGNSAADKLLLRTWPCGEGKWGKFEFDGWKDCEDVIYKDGKFYCVFQSGRFAAFNNVNHDWTLLCESVPIPEVAVKSKKPEEILKAEQRDALDFIEHIDWQLNLMDYIAEAEDNADWNQMALKFIHHMQLQQAFANYRQTLASGSIPEPEKEKILYNFHLVESEGELLLVCSPKYSKHQEYCYEDYFLLFGFDWSEMAWIRKSGLGDRTIIIDHMSHAVSLVHETSDLSDTIYYHNISRQELWIYSFKTRDYRTVSLFSTAANPEPARNIAWVESPF